LEEKGKLELKELPPEDKPELQFKELPNQLSED
jgi:hypothetical protein